ncbi:hypothetical protein LTR10_019864 [Elasticomyces elasticus]|uniref:WW domain-containing protein n=1 Tax=Exophiala sideris TaxID=1016849 RepID=A0ABR0IY19_9EURO|nr:hypothetical protein LTR10_019864 [Elasticomyces elasticus]KAK5022412.1 hypothetical protein LTS07_010072 [Exophiala sideris]KAK5027230.1 hypothetical protein LTR13_009625 [Exophiala sideris]KAK5051266.1 hypothetical protein LTR69_010292 [Exophiala sideris]KAK5177770.1 hypothetical protein LTR44_009745 [Eurotiomycetes sp. CCFEE 6388]
MTSPSLWIERGPNGRPYYVRKKSKQPSTWQLLTEALLPRSSRLLFTSRDSRQNNHVQCDQSENPLTLPAPRSPAPQPARTANPPPIAPNSHAQPLPVNMYLCPPQQKRDRSSSKGRDKNARNSNRVPQPPQTFFAGLPPPAFPMQPVPSAAYPMPPFPQPLPFSIPPQPFPAPPPGAFPATMRLENQLTAPSNLPPQHFMAEDILFHLVSYRPRLYVKDVEMKQRTAKRRQAQKARDRLEDSIVPVTTGLEMRPRTASRGILLETELGRVADPNCSITAVLVIQSNITPTLHPPALQIDATKTEMAGLGGQDQYRRRW